MAENSVLDEKELPFTELPWFLSEMQEFDKLSVETD